MKAKQEKEEAREKRKRDSFKVDVNNSHVRLGSVNGTYYNVIGWEEDSTVSWWSWAEAVKVSTQH